MGCRFKLLVIFFILPLIATGCLTLRIEKASEGNAVVRDSSGIIENKSTLKDILGRYGAPDRVLELEDQAVLVYENGFYRGASLSLGIPLSEVAGMSLNLSSYGRLWRYDSLALFFSPDWVLIRSVYVKGSDEPFLKTLYR